MKRITDPTFRYVSAASTDIRKTFARVRREMQKQEPRPANVASIKRKSA